MPDLTELQKALIWGALINSGLYLTGVFVAGMVTNNPFAWKLALVGAGLSFISYTCQYLGGLSPIYMTVAKTAVACSIVAGIAAGVGLLVR